MRRHSGIAILASSLALVAASCATDPTELVVLVDADAPVSARLDEVRLIARAPGSASRYGERTIAIGRSGALPVRFSLRASDGHESDTIEIVVEGLDGTNVFVRRIVRAQYVSESISLVRVRLVGECVDRCADGEDCTDGECGPPAVLPTERVDRDDIPPRGSPRDAAPTPDEDAGADASLDARTADAADGAPSPRDLGPDALPPRDTGPMDGAALDAPVSDATPPDATMTDAEPVDGGPSPMDALGPDLGPLDMSVPDLGPGDLGPIDLGAGDLGLADSGPRDLGPPDLGPPPPDLGPPDMGCIATGPESCNGIDDDCNDTIDDIVHAECTSPMPGICAPGTMQCVGATASCVPNMSPLPAELCNGIDDDCNGVLDNPAGAQLDCPPDRVCRDGRCEGILDVTAGGSHSCAITADGTGWCWGLNTVGQLGDGDTSGIPALTPVEVDEGAAGALVQIVAGAEHTCARTATGAVLCWGTNASNELATFGDASSATPVAVSLPGVATDIDAGEHHTCAIVGGAVYCWGADGDAQCGLSPRPSVSMPNLVLASGATDLALGGAHGCAITTTPSVVCWGRGREGQLGTPAPESATPMAVTGITNAIAIAAAGAHSCAILPGGGASCWGADAAGQLGNGAAGPGFTPSAVEGLANAARIESGLFHTCAVTSTDGSFCWGLANEGQAGTGAMPTSYTSATATMLAAARRISGGAGHTCAVLTNGEAWCFGRNGGGQLGNGAGGPGIFSLVPVRVMGLP